MSKPVLPTVVVDKVVVIRNDMSKHFICVPDYFHKTCCFFIISQVLIFLCSEMEQITTQIINEWGKLEKCLGYEVPMCLKLIMWKSGYDSLLSVKQMCEENILKVEKYVQKNRTKILPLLDDKIDTVEYKKQKIFEFLPGHRCILMDLPKSIKKMQSELLANDMIYDMTHTVENMDCGNNDMSTEYLTEYSIILRELINTAKKNHKKSKHGYQYNDTIKYFSTYIFLLCGRTCYETLNKNLPIPSTKTICEYISS